MISPACRAVAGEGRARRAVAGEARARRCNQGKLPAHPADLSRGNSCEGGSESEGGFARMKMNMNTTILSPKERAGGQSRDSPVNPSIH